MWELQLFGPKREEVTGDWRKLRSEKLHDLCCSPDIVWVINSMKIRLAGGYVARMGGK